VRDEAFRKLEAEQARPAEAVTSGRPTPVEAESSVKDPDARIAELTRALAATRERESDFRQAVFDLNAELLRKDAEIEGVREQLERTDGQLQGLMQTRAFRAVTFWWRVKAAIRPR
jgi:chromosome segregation ATPase